MVDGGNWKREEEPTNPIGSIIRPDAQTFDCEGKVDDSFVLPGSLLSR
jgi:hypothetical protein